MDGKDDSQTTEQEDVEAEAVVIGVVLGFHPTPLSVADLVREIAGETAGFAERDAIERAVRDLSGSGLVHRTGDLVIPTRAALRFSELLDR